MYKILGLLNKTFSESINTVGLDRPAPADRPTWFVSACNVICGEGACNVTCIAMTQLPVDFTAGVRVKIRLFVT